MRRGNVIGFLCCMLAPLALRAAVPATTEFEAVQAARRSGDGTERAVTPSGPGWLHLSGVVARLDPPPGDGVKLWISLAPGEPWQEIALVKGSGLLPMEISSVSDLWALRFRVEPDSPCTLTLSPARDVVLAQSPPAGGSPAAFTLTNWGAQEAFKARAVDATGKALTLASGDGLPRCSAAGPWQDLGILSSAEEKSLFAAPGQSPAYPVLVTVRGESGDSSTLVLTGGRNEATASQVFYYYGATKVNYGCSSPAVPNSTRFGMTGISDATTFTLTNLTTGTDVATGTVNKGQLLTNPTIPLLADNSRFRLAASKPVQAFTYYQCSNYMGSTFFLSDNGKTFTGSSFTVPLIQSPGVFHVWVFATGQGRVTVNRLPDNTQMDYHDFPAGGGAWQVTDANIPAGAGGTVYAFSSTATTFLVEQSSQNAATEVPPSTQSLDPGSCTTASVGQSFYFNAQNFGSGSHIAVFPYASGTYSLTSLTSGGTTLTNIGITAGTLDYRTIAAGSYKLTSTANVGLLAGDNEGTSSVWGMGDDAVYYQGQDAGGIHETRGHALTCGGTIFVTHQGTTLTGSGATTTPALGAGTVNLNAETVLDLAGNTGNGTLFDLTSQDSAHPFLVEVFGGNCDVNLNDWFKVMEPQAVARPVITVPGTSGYLVSATPMVTGTAFPGAKVTLFVNAAGPPVAFVWSGSAVADSAGQWTLAVGATLSGQTLYYFDAVQSVDGVCAADPNPPPGSGKNQGIIDVTPPAITAPANGSITYSTTPALSGTAPAGTTVTLTLTGPGGPYTVTAPADPVTGAFSVTSPLLPLGAFSVAAVATDGAGNVSQPSAVVAFTVAAPVNLLRYGGVTALSPLTPGASTVFVAQYPVDPALDPARDTIVSGFLSGAPFSPYDTSDLAGTPPLVFYQLQGNTGDTLRVTKEGGKIVIRF